VRILREALARGLLDPAEVGEELLARPGGLLPALGVEPQVHAAQVRLAAVEAARGGRRAGVVVDRLQRGADGGLLDDRRRGGPGLVVDTRAHLGLVVMRDRAADLSGLDELDQAEVVQRAHVVADGAQRRVEPLGQLAR
jgi:hypothetical protein